MKHQLAALLGFLAACGTQAADTDAAKLRAIAGADEAIVTELRSIEATQKSGHAAAVAIADGPLAKAAANVSAASATLTSGFGSARGESARKLTADRVRSLTAYRDAMESEDLEKIVAALEAEKKVDQEAVAFRSSVDQSTGFVH